MLSGQLADTGRAAHDPLLMIAAARLASDAALKQSDADASYMPSAIVRDGLDFVPKEDEALIAAMRLAAPHEVRNIPEIGVIQRNFVIPKNRSDTADYDCVVGRARTVSVRLTLGDLVDLSMTVKGEHATVVPDMGGISMHWKPRTTSRCVVELKNTSHARSLRGSEYVSDDAE